jgi:DNA-binding NarL/FixJ family response regulator
LNTTSRPFKVILADDHQFILETLQLLSHEIPNFEVVGLCRNGNEVLKKLEEAFADLVISDLHMPELDGLAMARQIQQHYPNTKVMMLTMSDESDVIRHAVQAGVVGYVLKNAGINEIKEAIEVVMGGGKYFDQENLLKLLQKPTSIDPLLTAREIDIIRLIAAEASSFEIGEKLFISEKTVETHRRNIINKLGVKNSVGVAMYAVKRGLV